MPCSRRRPTKGFHLPISSPRNSLPCPCGPLRSGERAPACCANALCLPQQSVCPRGSRRAPIKRGACRMESCPSLCHPCCAKGRDAQKKQERPGWRQAPCSYHGSLHHKLREPPKPSASALVIPCQVANHGGGGGRGRGSGQAGHQRQEGVHPLQPGVSIEGLRLLAQVWAEGPAGLLTTSCLLDPCLLPLEVKF